MFGCVNSEVGTIFSNANKAGCVHIEDVEINGYNTGDFTICKTTEFRKRVECGKLNGCEK